MPYADPEKKKAAARAYAKRKYDENPYTAQAGDLMAKLKAHYKQNEDERSRGVAPTSMKPKPRKSTLEKYGIVVKLSDERMFHDENKRNENPFIQTAMPTWKETERPGVPVVVNATLPVATQLERMKTELFSQQRVKDPRTGALYADNTLKKRFTDFKTIVNRSGCDDLAGWINDGRLLDYIKTRTTVRNTLKAYGNAMWLLVVDFDLVPGVHQSAKDKISKFSKDQNEIVRYHQFEVSEDDGKHIYQMSVIIDEALTKFSPMSDEMILLALYDELTLRDDYGDIKVYVEDPGLITDHNYYVLETGKIHFNYKKKVGDVEHIEWEFSDELKKKLSDYIDNHQADTLLPKKSSLILNNIGVGVHILRQSKVTELYMDETKTLEDKKRLALAMGHSFATQLVYVAKKTRRGVYFETRK